MEWFPSANVAHRRRQSGGRPDGAVGADDRHRWGLMALAIAFFILRRAGGPPGWGGISSPGVRLSRD